MSKEQEINVICVLGDWVSGATSETGYFTHLGVNSCPPHSLTTDYRTPNSFESQEIRLACLDVFDETILLETGSRAALVEWFGGWLIDKKRETTAQAQSKICLKQPQSAFLTKEIAQTADPTRVLVTSNFSEIEKTRLRRNWHANFGAEGAQRIYSRATSDLISGRHCFIVVAYEDFRAHTETRDQLIDFVGLRTSENQYRHAEGWLR